jgi:hypothetical protein
MSLCFNFARRTLLSPPIRHIQSAVPITGLPSSNLTIRSFSAAKKPNKKKEEPTQTYAERKAAAKALRTERYHAKQARLERLKTRRDNSPKDVKKNLFRGWWDKEVKYHAILVQHAKREGKPWRIRVATMLERLPVVMPDEPQWEEDWNMLRAYLDTYGKELPGFMPEDKEEDHIVKTNEEMLG